MEVKVFYFFIISFFVGIFTRSFFDNFISYGLWILCISVVMYIFFLFTRQKKPVYFIFFLVAIVGFVLGAARLQWFEIKNIGQLDQHIGEKIKKNIIVVDEPEKKGYRTKMTVMFENTKSKAIIWVPNYPKYNYGDKLSVSGYVKYPQNFTSPSSGREFDYVSFLKKDRIFYQIEPIAIEFTEAGQGNKIKEFLFNIKNSLLTQMKKIIPHSEASLLGGLILGAKEDMGKDVLDDFRKTGVIHIVVLSGYNLTLVADFFMKIFAFFGLALSSLFGSVAIVLFALMTGASATIVRASLMALLVIFAKATGRTSETVRALFLAGFLMLLFNPMLLVHDPSFQLSFLATMGLLMLSPKIEEKLLFIPKTLFDIRGIISATLATQIFVFPLLLYMMGEISIISPVVNVLILVFIPFVMLVGLIAVLVSYISLPIASLIAFVVYVFLAYDLALVDFFAKLPIAVFATEKFSAILMFLVYALYVGVFIFWKYYKRKW